MISDFAARFDSYYFASYDLRLYHECKGYRQEGDRTVWEPMYEVDLDFGGEAPAYAPGAMAVGELDCEEFYQSNDEPDLEFDGFDEF